MRLDEFQPNLTTDNCRGFLKSAQGHGIVLGIKEPVQRGAARMHPARHLDLGQAFLLHGSLNLAGNHPFNRGGANSLIEAFLAKPIIEGRSDILLFHDSVPFFRFSARSISCLGVFCVFFMKPCGSTMQSFSTQKITRAIRPCGKLLRTSHSSRPSERASGMPIGQENSTSLMSSPMILRSSASRFLSHSRTGSRPPSERKNRAGNRFRARPFTK